MRVIVTDHRVYRAPVETISSQMADDITTRLGADWQVLEVQELPEPPKPPKRLTVLDLKAALDAWPSDMPVLIPGESGWFNYVAGVVGPEMIDGEWSGEEGFALPTLVFGVTFDARDL